MEEEKRMLDVVLERGDSVKVIKGQRGSYGYEAKFTFKDVLAEKEKALREIKSFLDELNNMLGIKEETI